MLSISKLGKEYGAQTLFKDATIRFTEGGRYGIVGANGSGKSTLLKILSGEEEQSSGTLSIPKKAKVGVLRQNHFEYEEVPIIDVVMMGHPELWAAMAEKELLLANSHIEFDGDRYAELEDVVLRCDGYGMEARAAEILEGLNIPTARHREPLSALSGGFKLRALLAQTLASDPDILLLDEPTNHLDILSIRWLEKFLQGFRGTAVVVSHDRRFLDAVCTHIIDVDYQRATTYRGNYAAFERQKRETRNRLESEIEKRRDEIADHKAFVEKFKAKPSKARQAQSKAKRAKKIVIEELPESSRQHPRFRFVSCRHSGKDAAIVRGVSKSYGDQRVLDDVSLTVRRQDKLAIIGPNGIGKSTLLKIMMGELEPDSGTAQWGYEAHPGYFSQDHGELAGEKRDTVFSWLWKYCPEQPIGFVLGNLASVLFGKEETDKRIAALSGGEAARLLFARLSVTNPNILVLDEPTNHLDIEGIEALAEGLEAYDGTLILVSHNRWFVSRLANRIVEISADGIEDFSGTYSEYLLHCGDDHLDVEAVTERAKRAKRESKGRRG